MGMAAIAKNQTGNKNKNIAKIKQKRDTERRVARTNLWIPS